MDIIQIICIIIQNRAVYIKENIPNTYQNSPNPRVPTYSIFSARKDIQYSWGRSSVPVKYTCSTHEEGHQYPWGYAAPLRQTSFFIQSHYQSEINSARNKGWFTSVRLSNQKWKWFIKNHYLLFTIIFMTVFIRGAWVEDNTALECIRIVAVTYGCKILQLYTYEAKCKWYPKNTSSCSIKYRRLSGRSLSALSEK